MENIITFVVELLKRAKPRSFFDILLVLSCAAIFFLVVFSLSSCSLISRSSASGSRYVEKTVKQEQYWNVPAAGQPSQVNQIETIRKNF